MVFNLRQLFGYSKQLTFHRVQPPHTKNTYKNYIFLHRRPKNSILAT